MYLSLFKTLLGNYTTLFFISLLLILPMFISQQSFAQTCGDGTVDEGEFCDDGDDSTIGDGCTDCVIDDGFFCDEAEPSVCSLGCEITVEKVAKPAKGTLFHFLRLTLSLPPPHITFSDFKLNDPDPVSTETFNVPFLSATFLAELTPPEWDLESIVCEPTGNADVGEPLAEIQLFRNVDLTNLPGEVPDPVGFQDAIDDQFEGIDHEIVIALCGIAGKATCTYTNSLDVVNVPIPTLSEWGLLAMAGILGIVGFMVIRRRKVSV